MASPRFPKSIAFPLSGLAKETPHSTFEQLSTPPRFWYSELDRAWALATKATKGKSTRMAVNVER